MSENLDPGYFEDPTPTVDFPLPRLEAEMRSANHRWGEETHWGMVNLDSPRARFAQEQATRIGEELARERAKQESQARSGRIGRFFGRLFLK